MAQEAIVKILIVEDDYQLASEWQEELIGRGYRVDVVYSSEEVHLLLKNNYDFFIIDLFHVKEYFFLPDGGIKCISTIKKYLVEHKLNSKIIVVTGFYKGDTNPKISTALTTANLGAHYALKKPLKIATSAPRYGYRHSTV